MSSPGLFVVIFLIAALLGYRAAFRYLTRRAARVKELPAKEHLRIGSCYHKNTVEVRLCDWVYPEGEIVARLCTNLRCLAGLVPDFDPAYEAIKDAYLKAQDKPPTVLSGGSVFSGVLGFWTEEAGVLQERSDKLRWGQQAAEIKAEVERIVENQVESWKKQDNARRRPDGQLCFCDGAGGVTPHWHGWAPGQNGDPPWKP